MSQAEMMKELERLRKENQALKDATVKALSCKVSEKGAVSVYGNGRFPVTLYPEQWLRVLDYGDKIREFIASNESKLQWKHKEQAAA